jgi:hypothetical protein
MIYTHPFYFRRFMNKIKNTPECKFLINTCAINLCCNLTSNYTLFVIENAQGRLLADYYY